MTKQRILHGIASVSAGLVIAASVGVVGASQGHYNGGDNHKNGGGTSVNNDNDVAVNNTTNQIATTGEAKVDGGSKDGGGHHHWNKDSNSSDPGSATSGNAENNNSTTVDVNISNGSCGCLNSDTSDHRSKSFSIDNDNDVVVNNITNQTATSGDATVKGGNGGSAISGNASNTNTTTIGVTISN